MTYGIPTSSRSRSTRCSAGPPGSAACSPRRRRARQARATMVLGRDDRRRVRAAPVPPIRPRRRAFRRWHRQLPQPSRRRDRPVLPRPHRDRDSHARVAALGAWLLDSLGALRHSDGSPAATIDGLRSWDRHATIAFDFLHPDGSVVDERYLDSVARDHNISLRTDCFCNPDAGEVAFTISRETLAGESSARGQRSTTTSGNSACTPKGQSGPHSAWPGRRRSASIRRIHRRVHRPEERSGRSSATRELLS